MKKLITAVVLVALSATLYWYAGPMVRSATGLAARQACTLTFVSGLPLARAKALYVDRHIRPVGPWVHIENHPDTRSTSATLAGMITRQAQFRPGYGCVLMHGEPLTDITPWSRPDQSKTPIDQQERAQRFEVTALDQAVADAFVEPDAEQARQTVAVLVLSNGRLVAEQYAPDVDQHTPLPGFSMAKSMVATMIGVLVEDGLLSVGQPVIGNDQITQASYDQLLRMTSGLNVDEDGSGRDANSIMLTQRHDAAAYARGRGLGSTPGSHFEYSGGGPVILSHAFNHIAGDSDPSRAFQYLYERLIKPLNLTSVVLETDGTGTFLGSSFMSASALDWAKLGQLYLQQGEWQGQQIIPADWASYVSSHTEVSAQRDYGAGFWTTHVGGRDARHPELPRLPQGTFFMHGMMNQAVFILPQQQLVIVRLGATRDYLASGEWSLVRDVVAALKPTS